MATYRVFMERVVLETMTVLVEAESMEEAAQVAIEDYSDDDFDDIEETITGINQMDKLDKNYETTGEIIGISDFNGKSDSCITFLARKVIDSVGVDFQRVVAQKEWEKLDKVAGEGKTKAKKSRSI